MNQETTFQLPALQDLVKLAESNHETPSVNKLRLSSKLEGNIIPLAWFKTTEFRKSVINMLGHDHNRLVFHTEPRQTVYINTKPVKVCIKNEPGEQPVYEEQTVEVSRYYSKPLIIMWTEMGGFTTARADQNFDNKLWKTGYVVRI